MCGAQAAMVLLFSSLSLFAHAPAHVARKVDEANSKLIAQYEESLAPSREKLTSRAQDLKETLGRLYSLDGEIEAELKGSDFVHKQALEGRAAAWLHGWATFSHLTAEVSAAEKAETIRNDLLAIGGPDDAPSSALGFLLAVNRQMHKAETADGKFGDPLTVRLRNNPGVAFLLSAKWPSADEKKVPPMPYVPTVAEQVGTFSDDTKCNSHGVLSLWALVNLELDTWRGQSSPAQGGMDLQPLSNWLEHLASLSDQLTAFDQGQEKGGSGLKQRLRLVAQFTRFRHAIQNPAKLEAVVKQLELDRSKPTTCEDPLFAMVRGAATPVDGESLPTAEIWLRYLFLLSYRNTGSAVITGEAKDGVAAFWKLCGCPGEFEDQPRFQKESGAFLRWGLLPGPGHFDRAVHDATHIAFGYTKWEAMLPELEKHRFEAAITPNLRKSLAEGLAVRINELGALDAKYLAPYFVKAGRRYLLLMREPNPLLPDFSIKFPQWEWQVAVNERDRMVRDLRQFAGQVRGMTTLETSIRDVSAATSAEWAEKMRGLSTHLGGAEWDVTAMPAKTFKAYRADVIQATSELKNELERAQFERDLMDRYKLHREDADVRDLEYASATLGFQIAQKGQEMATLLVKVAELNVEIARLAFEAENLRVEAEGNNLQAAEKRLVLANRARDLAAAQLDALIAARDKAGELVKQAVRELEALRPRLEEIANKIEESKKSSFLSVLKAVVKVVSVALAPFTSGASLGIGAAVDQALTIVDHVTKINWDNPLQALSEVGEVVGDATKLADVSISKWGNADLNKKWGEVKGWIKARGESVTKLEGEAKTLIDHLKTLPDKEFRQIAGPLANAAVLDLPVNFDQSTGKVSFDLGKTGIRLNKNATEKLGKSLKIILESGGMLGADARKRVDKWAELANLKDRQLKTELPKAIDELIQTLPEGMVRDIGQTRETINNQKKALVDFTQVADDAGRRLLAQIITGNLVVVIDAQDQVTAVDRALSKELEQTRSRIKAFEESVLKGKMRELTDRIKAQQEKLSKAIDAAQQANDENTLRKIAREGDPQNGVVSVTTTVAAVKSELEEMDQQIELARGQLADAETGVDIGKLDLDRAKHMLESAEKLKEAGLLEKDRGALAKQAADLQLQKSALETEQKGIDLQVAARRVAGSRNALQRAYSDCLRWGVNPLQAEDGSDGLAALGLAAILTLEKQNDIPNAGSQARLHRAGQAIIGQLQWVRLVGQANPQVSSLNKLVQDRYLEVVDALVSSKLQPNQARNKLRTISDSLQEVVDKIENLPEPFYLKRYGDNQGRIVDWLDQPLDERLRDQEFSDVQPSLRHRVVGRFRFRIDPVAANKNPVKFPVFHPASDPTKDFFVLPAYARLVWNKLPGQPLSPTSIEFLIVPPRGATLNYEVALRDDREITWSPKFLEQSLQEGDSLGEIRSKLGLWQDKVDLRAALGDWNVYLLAAVPDGTEESRLRVAAAWKKEELRFDPHIPCVMFPRPK